MILNIEKGSDNSILRTKSKNIKEVTKKTVKLLKDMEATQIAAEGIGIAAPQVGINDRVVLVTLKGKKIIPLINAEILKYSDDTSVHEEGCLSLPGKWAPVERSKEVTVKYWDIKGQQEIVMKYSGFDARIVQHEVDHINGKLFIDHVLPEDQHLVAGNKMADFA